MAPILTTQDLIRRISAKYTYVDERGAAGAGGRDRAASRRANPPGAAARGMRRSPRVV
jgi:hypothetical protein